MDKINNPNNDSDLNRRDFIKLGTAAGVGAGLLGLTLNSCTKHIKEKETIKDLSTKPGLPKIDPIKTVKIGFVGVGMQGSGHRHRR